MRWFRFSVVLLLWVSLPPIFSHARQTDTKTAEVLRTGGTPYFTTKMANLTALLDLNAEQQAKLKPIAEQETGLLEEIRGNTVLSRKEKLARLQQVVLDSDKRMKSWLSASQWDKLQALRKEQKEQLKEYAKTK